MNPVLCLHCRHNKVWRDMENAVRTLCMARDFAQQVPDIVVSDEYPAHPRAITRAFGWRSKVKHVQAHFKPVIVRHKGFNSWLRERITILRGFKNDFYMEKYLQGFQKVWNSNKFLFFHFLQEFLLLYFNPTLV